MSKERIVKFSDGTFGVQTKRNFFSKAKFVDLDSPERTRSLKDEYFYHCKTENLERATKALKALTLTFTPLKTNLADHM